MSGAVGRYILAMAVFGTLAPFVRNIPISSGALALYRSGMGAALIGGYLLIRRKNPFSVEKRREMMLLLLSGGAMGFNWILLFEAYRYTTVSTATLCYYFAPVIVTALSPILFGERLTRRQVLCLLMAALGLALITGQEGAGSAGGDRTGILFGLGAASFYAAVILMNKYIRNMDGIERTFLQFLSAAVTLVPYVAFSGGVSLDGMNGIGWLCLLTVGTVHTGMTYCLYFSSLKALPGQKAAILSYIDPLVAVIVSVTFLSEPLTLRQALGGMLILGFTLWNLLPEKTA